MPRHDTQRRRARGGRSVGFRSADFPEHWRIGARREGFADVDAAMAWNAAVRARPALPREAKLEVDGRSVEELPEAIRRSAV